MLDIKFIRENPTLVQKGTNAKNFSVDIEKLLRLDAEIKPLQQQLEDMQAQRNKYSKEIAHCEPDKRENLKKKVIEPKKNMETLQNTVREKKDKLKEYMLLVAQPAREDVPKGKDDSFNIENFSQNSLLQFILK